MTTVTFHPIWCTWLFIHILMHFGSLIFKATITLTQLKAKLEATSQAIDLIRSNKFLTLLCRCWQKAKLSGKLKVQPLKKHIGHFSTVKWDSLSDGILNYLMKRKLWSKIWSIQSIGKLLEEGSFNMIKAVPTMMILFKISKQVFTSLKIS